MALFKRADLKAKGFNDEQIDFLMTESNRALANDYMLKSDLQTELEKQKQQAPEINIEETEVYKKLLAENAKIKALNTDDFSVVKKPYREMMWEKLDHSEKHKPYAEQLTQLAETMPDIFNKKEEENPQQGNKPQFGAEVTGEMPKGNKSPSFGDIWGYGKEK